MLLDEEVLDNAAARMKADQLKHRYQLKHWERVWSLHGEKDLAASFSYVLLSRKKMWQREADDVKPLEVDKAVAKIAENIGKLCATGRQHPDLCRAFDELPESCRAKQSWHRGVQKSMMPWSQPGPSSLEEAASKVEKKTRPNQKNRARAKSSPNPASTQAGSDSEGASVRAWKEERRILVLEVNALKEQVNALKGQLAEACKTEVIAMQGMASNDER